MNPLRIGLDFDQTITANEWLFEQLAKNWLAQGNKVHIITALKDPPSFEALERRRLTPVPYTTMEQLFFKDIGEVAELKLKACQRLNIDLMFDDMPSVCKLLAKHRIMTAQIRLNVL